MFKKFFILSLSIAVLLFLVAPITPADAGEKWKKKSKRINWRVAGPIVDSRLILLKAKGAPGRADLTILGDGIDFAGIKETPECTDKIIPYLIDGVEFVAVFADLSMLFARHTFGEAYICKNNGQSNFYFDMEIIGGTGRFDGASGSFIAKGDSYGDLYFVGELSAENGKFTGLIEFD